MAVKHLQPPLLVFGLIILAGTLAVMVKQTFRREVPSIEQAVQTVQSGSFKLSSPAFNNNDPIPDIYTCKGANVNPPLLIENAPGNAKEFVLIMHDTDTANDPVQWLVWNISVQNTAIEEHALPDGATQGTTNFGSTYSGPCPSSGTHHYVFELYALNDSITLDPATKRDGVISAINGKTITRTQLTGTVKAAAPKP